MRLVLEKWPFFLLTIGSCVLTYLAQREEAVIALEPFPFHLRLGNAALAYARYLLQMVWPANLAVIYPLPRELPWLEVIAAILFLAGVSTWIWRARNRHPWFFTGWFWYLGTLVPVIGLVIALATEPALWN